MVLLLHTGAVFWGLGHCSGFKEDHFKFVRNLYLKFSSNYFCLVGVQEGWESGMRPSVREGE